MKLEPNQLVGECSICGGPRPCPECAAIIDLEYDETYDPESGEENGWFWFEAKP